MGMMSRNVGLMLAASLGAIAQMQGAEHHAARIAMAGMDGTIFQHGQPLMPTRASNAVKLRDLTFWRGARRASPHHKGVPMTVAEGKRRARKIRNRQRHKKQWKRAVR